ncbi:MAG: VanZ family protein [Candidatus Cryptobacteroides sp.]|nr:VanZ family protein [Candidatus Cryptobacteroides sp.]
MTRSQKIAFQVIFFLYVAAVLFLCFAHFEQTPAIEWSLWGIPSDKVVHFCMFFPFPILAFLAFDRYTDSVRSTLLFSGITLLVGFLLAWGTEWGQAHLTDYRSGDPMDLLADGTALVLSTLLVIFLDIRKQKKCL